MMKSLIRFCFLLSATLFVLASCKKAGPKQTKFIPKNASFVASVNTGSLKDKLMKSQASLENIIRNLATDNDTALNKGKKEWDDFKNSGISLDENIYLWAVQKGLGNIMAMNMASPLTSAIAVLKDQEKFESYLKSKIPAAEIKKEKDYSYVTKDGDKIIAWGKEVVMIMSQQSMNMGNMEYDSVTGNFSRPPSADASAESNLKKEMNAAFNQKESESVASISEFADLAQQKADMTFWVNSGEGLSNMPIPLPKLKELAENNFTAATLNFDNGKIAVNSKSYAGKALKEIMKKYAGPEVNLDIVKQYPSANINGYMVFAFDPQFFSAIVKYMEVGAFADKYLTDFMGSTFTLQDALSAFKGDIAVIISDIAIRQKDSALAPGTMSGNAPKANLIFTTTVGDEKQMNKIMDRLVAINMLEKAGNVYRPRGVPESFGLTASLYNKRLTIGSDNNILQAYNTSKGGQAKDVEIGDFKGKAAVAYLNIESVLNSISATPTNNANADQVMPYAKQTFKDVKAYANNFNGEYTEGHFELRFKNEKENSLVTLLDFASKTSDVAKRNRNVNEPEKIGGAEGQ